MRESIVVVGSLNADLVVRVPSFPSPGETVPGTSFAVYPGGKGANQACAAARLGANVHMVGRVGDDDHGRMLKQSLNAAGVDTTAVLIDTSVATGMALITIDASGENEIVVVPGANAKVSKDDVARSRTLIEDAGFVLLQLEVPLETVREVARLARNSGTVVILDPAPARVEVLSMLSTVDYVTPNESELAALAKSGEPRELLALGAGHVVAKLGAEGARLFGSEDEHGWPGNPVEAVDTTAAGDVWNGAFAAALATDMEVAAAGRFANAAAALSVTRPGAQPSMPTRPEVEAFLSS
jgi:ribokinase